MYSQSSSVYFEFCIASHLSVTLATAFGGNKTRQSNIVHLALYLFNLSLSFIYDGTQKKMLSPRFC